MEIEDATERAYASYLTVTNDIQECKRLHLLAGIPLPRKVAVFLGESQQIAASPEQVSSVQPVSASAKSPIQRQKRRYQTRTLDMNLLLPARPDYGKPPFGADETWVSMKAVGASPHSLSLAVLKERGPISRADLSRVVSDLRGLKGSNAGYNALDRIKKNSNANENHHGYLIREGIPAGIIVDDVIWIKETELTDADRAAHRREGIILLLKLNGGLLSAEISRGLDHAGWIRAGKNPNFVKADMAQLEREGLVRRLEDKKWELA